MKKSFYTATACLAAAFLLLGCKKEGVTVEETPVKEQPVAEAPAPAPAPASAPSMEVMMSGEVVETMATAGYTYVLVDDGRSHCRPPAVIQEKFLNELHHLLLGL